MPCYQPRKVLDHTPPPWVDTSRSLYFITICCQPRGQNQLATEIASTAFSDAISHRVEHGLMFPYVLLLMPDHLHAIIGYNSTAKSLSQIVSSLKQHLTQQHGIK